MPFISDLKGFISNFGWKTFYNGVVRIGGR